MQLYYFRGKNFGDEINDWLWRDLLGLDLDRRPALHLSVIGTIISDKMPRGKEWAVLGSGVGYRPLPPDFDAERWNILAVRGPLTANILGIDPGLAITDGAILLADLAEYSPLPPEERTGIVYMPHLSVHRIGVFRAACKELGITYLDPTADSKETVQAIRKSSLVIADAMHAAIVADTMRVPWIPVASTRQISTFKWLDWALSMEVEYRPTLLPPATSEIKWKNRTSGLLGKKYFLDDVLADGALQDFRRRQRAGRADTVEAATGLIRKLRRSRPGSSTAAAGVTLNDDPSPSPASRAIAKVLQDLISRPPFLSRDDVYRQRLGAMKDTLSKVRDL